MLWKPLFSLAATALTLIAFVPYILSIYKNTVKPHVYSWVIWGVTTFIAFLAQHEAKGGLGAIPIGVSGLITLFVAVLAYSKRGDIVITKLDWLFLLLAISSLPFWYFTSNPLWAIIILTIVDLLGFGPTIRKAYHHPFEENIMFFSLFVTRNFFAVLAMETYSITTVLFPAAIATTCFGLILIIVIRRISIK